LGVTEIPRQQSHYLNLRGPCLLAGRGPTWRRSPQEISRQRSHYQDSRNFKAAEPLSESGPGGPCWLAGRGPTWRRFQLKISRQRSHYQDSGNFKAAEPLSEFGGGTASLLCLLAGRRPTWRRYPRQLTVPSPQNFKAAGPVYWILQFLTRHKGGGMSVTDQKYKAAEALSEIGGGTASLLCILAGGRPS